MCHGMITELICQNGKLVDMSKEFKCSILAGCSTDISVWLLDIFSWL